MNAANYGLWVGGICGVIFRKAGMKELTNACSNYGTLLHDGDAVITRAFKMTNAKAIIHAVGSYFVVKTTAFKELSYCLLQFVGCAEKNGYTIISFLLISSEIFGGSLEHPVAESAKQC